jgi:hypothetical protein
MGSEVILDYRSGYQECKVEGAAEVPDAQQDLREEIWISGDGCSVGGHL